jgi:hypothetical protein
MDPQPTTPPDGPDGERLREAQARARAARFEDDPLASDWDDVADDADVPVEPLGQDWGAGEDWRARYGAPPPPPPPRSGPDFSALFILLDGLRRAAPAELQDRLTSLIREGLMTLRSLIDWYLERLDRRPPEREVEDIPID